MMMGSPFSHTSYDPRYISNAMPAVNYNVSAQSYLPQMPQYENQMSFQGNAYQPYFQQPGRPGQPYMNDTFGSNLNPYYGQQPYQASIPHHQNFPLPVNSYQGQYQGHINQQQPFVPSAPKAVNPFENPLNIQQGNNYGPAKQTGQLPANPYPKQNFMQKQQSQGISSIINQFKTQDGSIDINKMMSTAGQMMNTVNQVSSIVKGFGGLFKVST
ncbi:hypothetical protein JOC77_002032 [Peribacillus deserti]|uniref:Spore coat protein n=1 Tax=Peribacillus deserti TaxID=673318 RepID=A0ABS2QHI4_9BACI|nr:YppG family protein [Peribacillus deserti]MBM7692602.1 hypothetical protein [Peribacillus deserti]